MFRQKPVMMSIQPQPRNRRQWRTQFIIVRRFQYKYAFFLAAAGFFASLVVGGIILVTLNNNFEILLKTQLLSAPKMVDNMYREFKLTNLFIVSTLVSFVIFLGMIGIKFSHRIVVPIYLIQEKMKEICRGNLKKAKVNIRKSDEFQEFGETYNYLVDSLKTQIQRDLERLQKIKPDEHNRDAVLIWQTMMAEKELQLTGDPSNASPDPADVSRHAS